MIKNIIFDLGDIFINIDESITQKELKNIGFSRISDDMLKMNEKFDKGLISTEKFKEFYKDIFVDKTEEELIQVWNSILIDFPINRLTFLEEIQDNFNLYLLSNTNELHVNYFKDQMGYEFYCRFKNCFKKMYYSYEVNLRKPEPEIFQFILEENGLNKAETLFVDDKVENTQAAEKLGLHVWNLDPDSEDVVELFEKVDLFKEEVNI